MALRVIFAGTPAFSVPSLAALIDAKADVVAVFTQPDRPSGRGRKLNPGPVKTLALEHEIPVHQPLSLKDTDAALWADIPCDLAVVVAYGLILPQRLLDTPRLGCINVHASLLPRWRGAAPINRAIEAGDATTGITLMQMDAGLDTGDILAKKEVSINPSTTAISLHDELSVLGAQLLGDMLPAIEAARLDPISQDPALASYAHKLSRNESPLDWRQDASSLARKVNALVPWPCTTITHGDVVLKLHSAIAMNTATNKSDVAKPGTVVEVTPASVNVVCGSGVLALNVLQKPGSRALAAREFINGYPLSVGERFTLPATETHS